MITSCGLNSSCLRSATPAPKHSVKQTDADTRVSSASRGVCVTAPQHTPHGLHSNDSPRTKRKTCSSSGRGGASLGRDRRLCRFLRNGRRKWLAALAAEHGAIGARRTTLRGTNVARGSVRRARGRGRKKTAATFHHSFTTDINESERGLP